MKKEPKKAVCFSVRLELEEGQLLDEMAKNAGVSRSWFVRNLIRRAHKEQKVREIVRELGFESLADPEKP